MKVVTTAVSDLYAGDRRLDASYHASEGIKALRTLRRWARQPARAVERGVSREGTRIYATQRLDRLDEVCKPDGIFIPGRFRRVYVNDPEHGERWLSPSDMLKADLSDLPLVSRKYTPSIDALRVHAQWILLSRSGTIGNLAYVREDMDGLVGSDDIIRIAPNPQSIRPGYLYAYLSSSLAKSLIEQKTYGAVVPHIEAHHVVDLPIPRLDPAIEERIHALVERAAALRVEANRSLDQVSKHLAEAIGPLPTVAQALDRGFVVRSNDLERLTAFSNRPSVDVARQAILRAGQYAPLGDVALRLFHPFRMNMVYVAEERGVPFLNLADMMAYRYRTMNFMSPRTQGFQDYLLEYGWTLISRDGTIGKVTFVGRYLQGTATNQHSSRVVPDTTQIPSGYLYAFMASPYAQQQIDALIYGSVILGVYERDLASILIPLFDRPAMQTISNAVEEAFEERYQANLLEDQAQGIINESLGMDCQQPRSRTA